MAFRSILFLAVLLVLEVSSSSDKKVCIKGKYEQSLGQPFTECYQTRRDLEIPRIKNCYQDIMKTKGVVKVSNNGQMTVDRQEFGKYARENSHQVGRAMQICYNNTQADDEMYREAARASQCVFDKVKKTC